MKYFEKFLDIKKIEKKKREKMRRNGKIIIYWKTFKNIRDSFRFYNFMIVKLKLHHLIISSF